MRIVIDTNVIASAVFFGGKPLKLINAIMAGNIESYISISIAQEYRKTVNLLQKKYSAKVLSFNPRVIIDTFIRKCIFVETTSSVNVCRDKEDNKFIECAVDAKCTYIVSGDSDLLDLHSYDSVSIVTVNDFLKKCQCFI